MICLSITSQNYDKCEQLLRTCSMAELRLDLMQLSLVQVQQLLKKNIACIATCRPNKQLQQSPLQHLQNAIQYGAKYVDIEMEASTKHRLALLREAKKYDCKIIISYHNFSNTPSSVELSDIISKCRTMGADIVKLVTTAQYSQDVARLLSLYEKENQLIAFAMGEIGQISRFVCLHLGAAFTYVSATESTESAPSQLTQSQALNLLQLLPPQ
ncbi:MAG: type I 3-dehydroquinate dehydratase [Bacteroidales bacterium]